MRIRKWLILTIVLVVFAGAAIALSSPSKQDFAGQKWEYLLFSININSGSLSVVTADPDESAQLTSDLKTTLFDASSPEFINNYPLSLDFLGRQGWELVSSDPNLSGTFIFKRPLS